MDLLKICTGGSTWFSGASAIGQVISGTFGMTYGTYQMVKGSVLLPFRALNAATGGFFFGLETATGAAGKMGVIGGAAWLVTSPIRLLNFVIGGVVGTINTLHDNTFIRWGRIQCFPRISPLKRGVSPTVVTVSADPSHPFYGKTFVLTGTLTNYTRSAASELIKERGGKIGSTVSAKVDYLLFGDDPGSKWEKAKKLKVSLLSEEEFQKML